MPDYVLPAALVILTLVYAAWRERRNNLRDAKLLAAFGLGSTLAVAAVWLG